MTSEIKIKKQIRKSEELIISWRLDGGWNDREGQAESFAGAGEGQERQRKKTEVQEKKNDKEKEKKE